MADCWRRFDSPENHNADVTLVGETDVFVERVRLHQYAANQKVNRRRMADILQGTRISFLRGTAHRVDLERLGVSVRPHTKVTGLTAATLSQEGGADIPFDACLWCGGFSARPLARDAGLTVNNLGQVLIDPNMRSISHSEVFALGDAAHPAYEAPVQVRMAAFTALTMAAHAADCLANVLNDKPLRPFGFAYVGLGIALGRHDVVGFNTYPYGNAHWPMLTGRFGVWVREFFVDFLANTATIERMMPGAFFWLGKARTPASPASTLLAHSRPAEQVS